MFELLRFSNNPYGNGIQAKHKFPNGYGCSVIRSSFSIGGRDGLFEIAVIGKNGRLCYNTPVTDDTLGYLTPSDVNRVMKQISELP